MKPKPPPAYHYPYYTIGRSGVWIQAPLPACLDTLPILLSVPGHGSGRQGPPPLAPAEEPAND